MHPAFLFRPHPRLGKIVNAFQSTIRSIGPFSQLREEAGLSDCETGVIWPGMKVENLRSPYEKVGGIVYFGRMLDKIRLNDTQHLPVDYHPNLGAGFDLRCVKLLGVQYKALVARTRLGGSDDEILAWCQAQSSPLTEEQIEVWNDFMIKRGWRDAASERVHERKREYGLTHRSEIQTFFDLIEWDEERLK